MLCCRSHLGHIAFDEVDLSLRSFNSGFAYIISARNKLFLWKGAGCTVDELSCARIFAMQDAPSLGLSANLEEIAEGDEPVRFLDVFPQPEKGAKKIFPTAEFWKLRPRCGERYRVRLFRVHDDQGSRDGGNDSKEVSSSFSSLNHNNTDNAISLWPPRLGRRPSWHDIASAFSRSSSPTFSSSSQTVPSMPVRLRSRDGAGAGDESEKETKGQTQTLITELAPFSQSDLLAEGVFVLDAFFEVYM